MEIQNNIINSKVLIVDDSQEIIDILGNILQKNIKCQVALNGFNALKILNSSKDLPDLILLDVLMPGMDGYDLCKQIKTNGNLRDIPIIFISGLNDTFDKVKAFRIGAVDYITKPFQKDEVIARVNAHLEISNSRKVIKELYSKTIQGTINAINDILVIANPEVSRISNSMKLYSELILKELSIMDAWDLKLACLLSGIGMLTESIHKEETKYFTNVNNSLGSIKVNINFDINKAYDSLSLSAQIVDKIPKFNNITKIIRLGALPLNKKYHHIPVSEMLPEVLKGQILRILIFYFYNIERESNFLDVIDQMRNSYEEFYSHELLDILHKVELSLMNEDKLELYINELKPNMTLVDDLYSFDGKILLKSGYELSEGMILLLKNYRELNNIKLKVIRPLGE